MKIVSCSVIGRIVPFVHGKFLLFPPINFGGRKKCSSCYQFPTLSVWNCEHSIWRGYFPIKMKHLLKINVAIVSINSFSFSGCAVCVLSVFWFVCRLQQSGHTRTSPGLWFCPWGVDDEWVEQRPHSVGDGSPGEAARGRQTEWVAGWMPSVSRLLLLWCASLHLNKICALR